MAESDACVTKHSAYIFDRGGKRRVDEILDLSEVKWERARDNISEASIKLVGDACDTQADLLASLRTHRHELVIFRGRARVWEGPLHRISYNAGSTEIFAKDVLAYAAAQPMTQEWDNSYPNSGTVSGRIGNILSYELTHGRTMFYSESQEGAAAAVAEWVAAGGVATPTAGGWMVDVPAFESTAMGPAINVVPHMVIHPFPNEARTSAHTLPYEMSVFEHLTGLARQSGIDYTVVGRAIHPWDVSRYSGRLPTITDADFHANVIVTEYGSDHAQAAYVVGQEGAYGSALNLKKLAYYGPWSAMYTAYSEEGAEAPEQSELDSQAQRNVAGRTPAPMEVRIPDNSSFILRDDIGINQLVPGVQVYLRATMNQRKLAQMQKIDHVVVTENAAGETVQLTLTPATRRDSDEVAP